MSSDPSRIDANKNGQCPRPTAALEPPRLDDHGRELHGALVAVLRSGGSRCILLRGSFPPQFIVAGTADQIRRLLDEPAL
jgi:hypothetical protein